tara:strand:- start:26711 stop:27001 length:291 start_codon:yes stop_codon:yes gene_type:complete
MLEAQVKRDPLKQVAAVSIVNAGIFAAPYTTPLIIGALMVGFRINEAQAGSLITAELVAMGVIAATIGEFATSWACALWCFVVARGNGWCGIVRFL